MPAAKTVGTHQLKAKAFKTKTPPGVVDKMPLNLKARVSDLPPGREGFLTWLYNSFPEAYASLEARAPHVLDTGPIGFGGDDAASPGGAQAAATATPSWVQTIQNIALPALQLYEQKKVVDLQLQRAAAGQRPLDIASYMGDASIRTGLDSSTTKTLYIVLGIGAGVYLLSQVLRSRR